ncbi:MAG: L,D-transpeptidase [bacterium]|nr:L,D-transpeptidase [bacterium]
MSAGSRPSQDPRLAHLVARSDPGEPMAAAPRWLLVDVAGQQAILVQGGKIDRIWPASTASAGLDARQGSGGTPPGLHAIERRIGAGAEPGTVYESREPTGDVWRPGDPNPDDLILTRVITLRGLEPGVNAGPGVDSQNRYIYLHGTNHEDRIGQPVSHGCIRLRNRDVVELFDLLEEGDPVVIV